MWSARVVGSDNRQPTELTNEHLVQCDVRDIQGVKDVFFLGAQSRPAVS